MFLGMEEVNLCLGDLLEMAACIMIPIYCLLISLARNVPCQHSVLVQAHGFETFSSALWACQQPYVVAIMYSLSTDLVPLLG